MSRISKAIKEFDYLSAKANENTWINNINPLVKVFDTVLFICLVVSFNKYQIASLISMFLYPFIIFVSGVVSFKECMYRLRIVLPVVVFMGIFNLFFDREVEFVLYKTFAVTGGMLTFISLVLKGVLTVLAAYFLICTTTVEKICWSLRCIKMPKVVVTMILLIYRYISVLFKETERMVNAYELRSGGSKGIEFKAWGSFAGLLLIRTMDRADELYESMCLRGYKGEFNYFGKKRFSAGDFFVLVVFSLLAILFRNVNVFELMGRFFA